MVLIIQLKLPIEQVCQAIFRRVATGSAAGEV
jgi:hypothetical protein